MHALAILGVLLLVLVLVLAAGMKRVYVGGGSRSPNIIVDTLNVAWSMFSQPPTPELIAKTIDRTAPVLRAKHSGRVMYVLKDRDSVFNSEASREIYRLAAERNRVYVYVAERYVDAPQGVSVSDEHSAKGRDDFFIALLAKRWRCPVLTDDRLRDFSKFRATLQPFHVFEFAFWRVLPEREFVRPESPAYARIKKPRTVRFKQYF